MTIRKFTDSLYPEYEYLYTFKDFPVFMGTTEQNAELDILSDMNVYIDNTDGILQIHPLLSLDLVYQQSHNSGAIGKIWLEHHSNFASFISKQNPSSIFEIGGGVGQLYNEYKDNMIPWTILEPNPSISKTCLANIIKGFFDKDTEIDNSVDTIIHSHVFEHMYDPNLFMSMLSDAISNGKKLIFSVPNMKRMLEKKFLNCLNFEHTFLLTEEYIEWLLSKHSFRIVDKEYYLNEHSIFYAVIKDVNIDRIQIENNYNENKKLFIEYINYYKSLVVEINEKIKDSKNPVYLFGAHIFSQYLINFGLDISKINTVLDNDSTKQNKRLYGTSLTSKSPMILKGLDCPIVILKAGALTEEIKKDILENINPTTIFL